MALFIDWFDAKFSLKVSLILNMEAWASWSECSSKGGVNADTCASGFGVCCTCK